MIWVTNVWTGLFYVNILTSLLLFMGILTRPYAWISKKSVNYAYELRKKFSINLLTHEHARRNFMYWINIKEMRATVFFSKKKIIHDKKWITKSNWGAPIIFIYQHSNSIVLPKVHSFGLRSPTLYDVMRHRIPNTANNHKCLSQLVHHMEHT